MSKQTSLFSNLKGDLSAGLVVFLIAVPLCLGIALASGAPLFAGMISGILGGLIIGSLSGSQLSVSGPAAGLTAVVLTAITKLGAFDVFLLAVMIGGAIQLLLGIIKAGTVANYFPSNVIKGMLTAIGIIIILKQIPHAFGYDKNSEGDFTFIQVDGDNSFTALLSTVNHIHLGATLITLLSILIILY
ncbi:MAG TPA: SulP family inorganic anion transporter, partial [Niastella sp.]